MSMLFGKYTFTCRFESNAILPVFKGSTLRGVFGLALKRVVCALKQQTCDECPLRTHCLYTQIFETDLAFGKPQKGNVSAQPHPFVIVPPLTEKTDYSPGEEFSCDLILFGEFNQKLPYFIYAFQQMGRIGIGKKINGCRSRFSLQSVATESQKIYTADDDKIYPQKEKQYLSIPENLVETDDEISVRITFETPFRSKYKIYPANGMSFDTLARTMTRRMTALLNAYGAGEPAIDYSGLIQAAEGIQLKEHRLNWFDWQRFSNRQHQRMPMGGITGYATYNGKMNRFWKLIEFCINTHIGKQTAFGLGKINAELLA